ncbi:MAG: hypothetical protein BGN97_04175 [Microbacterium sp. 69-10]|nr:MAG: hypothetical protein BGN97_04175 [Microbacterium sp. 69-10]
MPEAFARVEAGVVEGWAADVFWFVVLVVVGFWFGAGCEGEGEGFVESHLPEGEEPFDGAAAVRFAHPAVAAQQVPDLAVDAAFQRAGSVSPTLGHSDGNSLVPVGGHATAGSPDKCG